MQTATSTPDSDSSLSPMTGQQPFTLSLVEDDGPARPHRASWHLASPPSADELLQGPLLHLQNFGAPPYSDEDPMQIMQGKAAPVAQLSRSLESLVQMLDSFRTPTDRRTHWWRWFTGEALEREVTFWHACQNLESTAAQSKALADEVREMRAAMLREQERAREYAQWLAQLLDVVAVVLSDTHASRRESAAFKAVPDYWPRFRRRVETLQALQTATGLSAEQFTLADSQTQAVLDRYAEVITLLVPLWRQRTGFELFAKVVIKEPR